MPSKLLASVSVRTKLPLIIATPRTIANAVSAARSLRPSSPLRATPIIGRSPPRAPRGSRASSTRPRSLTIGAVGEEEDAVGDRRCVGVVRDHDRRLAVARRRSRAAASRISPLVVRVEVAGRLVGEHHGRARDERAGDRDALLLAAGELGRAVLAPVAEADLARSARRATRGRASRRRSTAAARCSPPPSASAAG